MRKHAFSCVQSVDLGKLSVVWLYWKKQRAETWSAVSVWLLLTAHARYSAARSGSTTAMIKVNMIEKIQLDKLLFDTLMHFSDDPIDNQMILLLKRPDRCGFFDLTT